MSSVIPSILNTDFCKTQIIISISYWCELCNSQHDWKKVLFTDQSKIEIYGGNSQGLKYFICHCTTRGWMTKKKFSSAMLYKHRACREHTTMIAVFQTHSEKWWWESLSLVSKLTKGKHHSIVHRHAQAQVLAELLIFMAVFSLSSTVTWPQPHV